MKKLLISHSTLFHIYDFILQNKSLPTNLYKDLLHIIIYILLGEEIAFCQKSESVCLPASYDKNLYLHNESLEKTLYLMDATSSLDNNRNVSFSISGFYREQILYLIETRGAEAARTEALVLTKASRLFNLGLSLGLGHMGCKDL